MKRKLLVLIAVILLILGLYLWQNFNTRTQQPQYQTAYAQRGIIVSSVSASGQILSSNVISVTTNDSGTIKEIFVSEGENIAKGAKIAEVELDAAGAQKNAAAWSSYLSAKNNLDSANATLHTLQSDLFAKNQKFISDAVARGLKTDDPTYIQQNADWLFSESKYKNQQGVILQSQAALNSSWLSYQLVSSIIFSPASGTVENITIAPGIIIGGEGGVKVAVIRNDPPAGGLASFNLSEIDVARVKIGQKATITADAISGKTFAGKVVAVDKIGQVVSNVTNYPAIIQLDTDSQDLLPNMSATVSIIADIKDNVLFVPSQAVQTVGDQTTARVIKNGQIQSVPVKLGITGDQGVEIVSGLSEGDKVIVGTLSTTGQRGGTSPFGGFGGGGLRPGGFGGGARMQQQH